MRIFPLKQHLISRGKITRLEFIVGIVILAAILFLSPIVLLKLFVRLGMPLKPYHFMIISTITVCTAGYLSSVKAIQRLHDLNIHGSYLSLTLLFFFYEPFLRPSLYIAFILLSILPPRTSENEYLHVSEVYSTSD